MRLGSQRICALLLLIFPTWLVRWAVHAFGHSLERGAKVGFSWVCVERLELASTGKIGHFNRCAGAIRIALQDSGHIGHFNTIVRARFIGGGPTSLTLGRVAKITSRHRLDLTCSISIGDFSTVAGTASQLWTHGYVHAMEGVSRYRIDGPIVIEANVYVGTMSFISMGVRIARGVIVGGGSSVAKSLLKPGLYVSGSLRQLPRPADPDTRADLEPIERSPSEDIAYRKKQV